MDKKTMVCRILKAVEIGCLAVLAVKAVADLADDLRCMLCSCDKGCYGCSCGDDDSNPCHMACAGMADDPDGVSEDMFEDDV